MNLADFENGMYIKAKICGVSSRTVSSKDGTEYTFFSLIVETSLTAQKQYIELGRRLEENGVLKQLHDERLVGRTALIPVYLRSANGYTSINYAGNDLPHVWANDAPAKSAQAASAAAARQ